MKHVTYLKNTGNSRVTHLAEADSTETVCGWSFVADEQFDGKRVYLAATSNNPVTCRKCRRSMNIVIERLCKQANMTVEVLEKMYDMVKEAGI